MSIFDRSKLLVLISVGIAALAVLRCAPPDACLRISDCGSGLTCVEGDCVPDLGPPGEGGVAEGGSSDVTVAEAASRAEASVVTPADASATDAADSGDSGDGGDGATSASSDASPD